MNKQMLWMLVWALGLLPLIGLPGDARAQERTRTLSIREGKVYLDGKALAPGTLPSGIDLRGVQAEYRFTGTVSPVVGLNGQFFTLGEDGLIPYDGPEGGAPVGLVPPTVVIAPAPGLADAVPGVAPVMRAAEGKAARAASMVGNLAVRAELLEEQRRQQGLYLEEVRARDHALFERLAREEQMEAESFELAVRVKAATSESARKQAELALKQKLDQIFELKQENRREEIKQLEESLNELRTRLREREKLRARIIEQRLQELVDRRDPDAW